MLLIVLKFFVFNWWALSFPCYGPFISPFYHCSHQQGYGQQHCPCTRAPVSGAKLKGSILPYCVDICELGGNTAFTEPPHWVCPSVLYWGTSSGQSERPGGSVCFFSLFHIMFLRGAFLLLRLFLFFAQAVSPNSLSAPEGLLTKILHHHMLCWQDTDGPQSL